MIADPVAGTAPDLIDALAAAGLPTDDLAEAGRSFFRFSENGQTVGFGGFELYGDAVLLRSIVILQHVRGAGHGSAAVNLLAQCAAEAGARTAYLLTTDAAPFFEQLGFAPIPRSSAPQVILETRQAAALCPATATLLARPLPGAAG